MNITRLSLPAFPALSDAQIEEWLRIDPNQDSNVINMLLSSSTEYVEGLTGLTLGLSAYRLTFDCVTRCYPIPFTPVSRIINVRGRDANGALVDLMGWTLVNGAVHFDALPITAPVIEVEVGHTDDMNTPVALRHAIAVLVSAGYNGREELTDQTMKTVDRLCQRHKRMVIA